MTGQGRQSPTEAHRLALLVALVLALGSLVSLLAPRGAAAVAITVPYTTTGVADADLDGDPATGTWSDAASTVVPLENGETSGYGSATLYTKHDGTYVYFRIDGQIDVPWTGATANHFWLGMQISPSGTSHHSGGTWDGVFFGLWDGTDYTPQPAYPPSPVDTNGFGRPPAKDGSQDDFGKMRYSGSIAPYSFTAEWKRKLNTGDSNDIAYAADGATTYNFFVTTDSNGGGSSGGAIDHHKVTNLNTMRFATPGGSNSPPQVDLTAPDGGEVWSGGTAHSIWWNMSDAETATTSLRVWINYSVDGGLTYAPIPGAQDLTGLSSPSQFPWSVPTVDAAKVRVRVTVMDAQGATASDASLADFAIDSTGPFVRSINPANGSTGVPITAQVVVSFSEPMNVASAEQAFSLQRTDTGEYVVGAFSWVGDTMTFTPSGALVSGATFLARVNATARDVSDPGNLLTAGATSSFTTGALPPPFESVAVVPPVQEAGQPVNITAWFVAGTSLSSVNVTVFDWNGTAVVLQELTGSSQLYWTEVTLRAPGDYTFLLSAVDSGGAITTFQGSFTIVDTTPPVAVTGPDLETWAGTTVTLDGSASYDNSAIVNYTWSFTYNGATVTLYGSVTSFLFGIAGQYTVVLEVVDSVGLRGSAQLNVTVRAMATVPPTSPTLSVAATGDDCLELTWTPSVDTDLAGYRIYRWNETSRAFDLIATVDANTTSSQDCGLNPDTVYSYWVVAFDASGNASPPSPIVNGRILAGISPSPNPATLYETVVLTAVVLVIAVVVIRAGRGDRKKPPQAKSRR